MNLSEVVQRLETFAGRSLAEDWDNVGLLIEPSPLKVVKKIMLTNDLTSDVMNECVEAKADMIISYHPPIFRPMKRFNLRNWKEEIVIHCISNNIALYSPHTSFDAVKGGVNDWLISPYGPGIVEPVTNSRTFVGGQTHLINIHVDPDNFDVGRSTLAQIDGLSVVMSGQKESISVTCSEGKLPSLMSTIATNPGLFNNISIVKLEKAPINETGAGRTIQLNEPISLCEAVKRTKEHLHLNHVRLAIGEGCSMDSVVRSIAVCAGSGSSVLGGVKANLLVTGEMSHHEVLDAVHSGSSVILCEHSNTERGFLKDFSKTLTGLLDGKVNVTMSKVDRERLIII